MLQRCLVFMLSAMLCALPIGAADHVVTSKAVDRTLTAAATERTRNLSTLDEVLSSPAAVKAAASTGVDLARVKGALPSLSDRELRDLASRSASLRTDVVAGHYYYDDAADGMVAFVLLIAVLAAVVIVLDRNY